MSEIRQRTETLSQVVDRLSQQIETLTKLAEGLDLNTQAARPYEPPSPDAVRAHVRNLELVYEGEQLAQTIGDLYANDPALLAVACDEAGLTDVTAPAPVDLATSRQRIRDLRSSLSSREAS